VNKGRAEEEEEEENEREKRWKKTSQVSRNQGIFGFYKGIEK